MKRVLIVVLISIVCLLSVRTNKIDFRVEDQRKFVTIGIVEDNEPYSYKDSKGIRIGFNVDVIDELFNELNYKINYVPVTHENFLDKLENSEIDLIGGIQYDIEYINKLKYSKPLIKNTFNIFVKTSDRSIRNISDLSGKKISVYRYDPAYQRFKNSDNIRVFLCESQRDAYLLLRSGVVDAFVANRNTALSYIEDSIGKGNIMIVGEKYTVFPSAIAALNKNGFLIEEINIGIDRLKNTGKLDKLQSKWFGEEVVVNLRLWRKITTVSIVVGLVLILIIFVIARINNILKKEVEQRTNKIKEEIEYKEAITDSLFDHLITLDNNFNITVINRRVRDIEIIKNKNILNKKIQDTDLVKLIFADDIKNVYITKEKILNRERKIDNGIEKYVEYNIVPVIINDEMEGVAITLKDITNEKRMQRKIYQQDKMESLGRLTAGIAHEIRNPLASIDMYLKLLPEKIDNVEFRKQIVEDIPKEISRLNNLIKSLLDYSIPRPSESTILNVKTEIEFVLRLLKNEIDNDEIDVISKIDDNIDIRFDKDHFRQIILNIILNAIEALKNVTNPMIEISYQQKKEYLNIFICNNGGPIDCEIADNIFEPFFTTKVNGYGLGLSIVSQLCKENSAEITLDKNYKKGAKFIIEIATF
ncbi:putative Sensory transduction protein kinase [[Clostridium] ultunense Esp]|uniref:transporter substrate-binding domain-containing protein n=1 Tax=Schnuerera ultunensis TaxID=45497 RepID=UPI0002B7045F|nr:transporter substrate-binding domain-containing protein [Schnuerera ultunensis]CCQ98575.1 putative Sensory transduction protein kinase [[Clostridium] ultunense Esp]